MEELFEIIVSFVFGQSTQEAIRSLIGLTALVGFVSQFIGKRRVQQRLKEEMEAQTRTGDIEMGITIFDPIEGEENPGGDGEQGPQRHRMRLVAPEHPNLEDLFTNDIMKRTILAAHNDDRRGPAHNFEGELVEEHNYGFLRLDTVRNTRGMMIQVRNRYRKIFGLLTTIAGAGVPCRNVTWLVGVRLDDWPTAGMADGFQTYRAIAALKKDCEAYVADPEGFRATHLVDPAYIYQDDRFLHLGEMHRLSNSTDKHDRAMIVEFDCDIPVIFFQDFDRMAKLLKEHGELGEELIELLKSLRGRFELEDRRHEELSRSLMTLLKRTPSAEAQRVAREDLERRLRAIEEANERAATVLEAIATSLGEKPSTEEIAAQVLTQFTDALVRNRRVM